MIRFKDINIPKPCSVDYDTLIGNEVKRFCGSCEKHVYDFRGKDEAYLNEVFQKTGKVCGIYNVDQIQKSSLKIQRPFFNTFSTKIISIGLFIKTILNPQDTSASVFKIPQTTQESFDSTGVKVHYKERNIRHDTHKIEVYVNNNFYSYELSKKDSILYLPDSIQPNDKIKIIVVEYKRKTNYSTFKTKRKEHNFIFKNHEKITIKINCSRKRRLLLFKKRTSHIMGKMRAF